MIVILNQSFFSCKIFLFLRWAAENKEYLKTHPKIPRRRIEEIPF